MTREPSASSKRRPVPRITLGRASRLHRLVRLLAEVPRTREAILGTLGVGLRTFYRELELLNRCGVKVRLRDKHYALHTTMEQAEQRLPFPDPQLNFAELAELASYPGKASKRLAAMLESVTREPPLNPRKRGSRGGPSRQEKK